MTAYDDRDGFIWMDGKLVEWRAANVHILTHALHYASTVFEGERCYNGRVFKGHEHSLRLLESGRLIDMPIPYTADEIDAAKTAVLHANGLTDAYIRSIAFRGAGTRWVSPALATRSALPWPAGPGAPITATPRCRGQSSTSPNGDAPARKPSPPQQRPPVST